MSTSDQNPTNAMVDLRHAATQRGLAVALAVAETGSGKRNDRPGLQHVLEAARRGDVSTVLVTRLDRFGRSAVDLLANIRALTDAGVSFQAVEQGLVIRPAGEPISQLLLTMLAGVAEFEHSIIRERVVEGQRRAKARGQHIGRPFGTVGPNAPERGAVERLRAAGASWREVGEALKCTPASARRAARRTQEPPSKDV